MPPRSRREDVARHNAPAKVANADSSATESSTLLGETTQAYESLEDTTVGRVSTGKSVIDDYAGLPWWRTPSAYWLLGPFAVFTLAFGGIIVPKLNLILDLVCRQYFADKQVLDPTYQYTPVVLGTDNPQCLVPEVQRRVATFMLVASLITGLLSAVVAPKLGHLSDRYGRTSLMAMASCGGLMNELITILAAKFPETVDYRWLLLGATFDGFTGSFTAGTILSQSYTSDCTVPSKRAVAIGYIHACLFTGLALGPLLAGYFVKVTGSLLSVFYIALGCHLTFILCVAFVIPESLPKRKQLLAREKHRKAKEEQTERMGSWLSTLQSTNPLAPLQILWPQGPGTSSRLRINLVALAGTDMVIMGSMISIGSVLMLYSESTFHWGTWETSRFISSISMVRVFILLGIFPVVNYIFRTRPAARRLTESGLPATERRNGADRLDIWILRVALISDIMGSVGYIFVRTEALFFASAMTTAVGGLGSATIGAAITKHVPTESVGQVLGAVGMLQALARVVGPVLFNGLYAATVGVYPQAVFVLLTCLFGLGLICSFVVKPHVIWEDVHEDESQPLRDGIEAEVIAASITNEEQIPIR